MSYGNALDSSIHLGEATIRMGEPDDSWEEILAVSLTDCLTEKIQKAASEELGDQWWPQPDVNQNKIKVGQK